MSEELERCPFCRSSIVGAHVNDFHLHEVGCGACGCSGPAEASEAEAIAAWNRRAPAQPEPAAPLCRTDGRCQYAIDHGAEGLGHCPEGKCAMPEAAPTVVEPVAWRYREDKGDWFYVGGKTKPTWPWEIPECEPLYLATPPRAALTDEQIVAVMESCLNDWDWKAFARAIEAAHGIGEPK